MTAWPCPPLLTAADQSLSPPRELPIQEPRCREGGPARALRRVPPTVSYGQTPRLHGSERALFKPQATKPVCAKPSLPAHVNRINLLFMCLFPLGENNPKLPPRVFKDEISIFLTFQTQSGGGGRIVYQAFPKAVLLCPREPGTQGLTRGQPCNLRESGPSLSSKPARRQGDLPG